MYKTSSKYGKRQRATSKGTNSPKPTTSPSVLPVRESEKLRLGGRVKIDVTAAFPNIIEGEGDAKVFFRLPMVVFLGLLRKAIWYLNSKQNTRG